ncbi:MAG: metal-dependent hydrolase, partial [Nitrospirae bacterium]|nr:metal-dependent hydrolase [Nitrospirota bacterium]
MASAFAHAAVAVTLATAWVKRPKLPVRFWVLGAACAMGPDLDILGYWLGIPYEHILGHRGLTHSLPFAAVISGLVVGVGFSGPEWVRFRPQLLFYFFVATASHGVFDAMTQGGLGVAFFAPFEPTRYFFPFRPIPVFPIEVSGLINVFL